MNLSSCQFQGLIPSIPLPPSPQPAPKLLDRPKDHQRKRPNHPNNFPSPLPKFISPFPPVPQSTGERPKFQNRNEEIKRRAKGRLDCVRRVLVRRVRFRVDVGEVIDEREAFSARFESDGRAIEGFPLIQVPEGIRVGRWAARRDCVCRS